MQKHYHLILIHLFFRSVSGWKSTLFQNYGIVENLFSKDFCLKSSACHPHHNIFRPFLYLLAWAYGSLPHSTLPVTVINPALSLLFFPSIFLAFLPWLLHKILDLLTSLARNSIFCDQFSPPHTNHPDVHCLVFPCVNINLVPLLIPDADFHKILSNLACGMTA